MKTVAMVAVLLSFAEKRMALVIGNGNDANLPDLRNPVNDATDMAAALKKLGFAVTLKTDADRRTMNQAIVAFREELAADQQSEGVFYFAGHGVQSSKGQNYLMPVDATVKSETDLEDEAVRAQKLLDSLDEARNRVNLVILDACRDNPLPATARSSGSRGLAVVSQAPPETVLLYSTAAGQTASDGSSGSRNSPFTAALLKHLSNPADITQVIKLVTGEVKATTPEKQTPFVYSNLSRDFVLNKSGSAAAQASDASKAPSFGAVASATGNLNIQLATAGTVSVAGLSAAVLAGTVPVNDLAAGSQTVTVRYADGKTESRTVTVQAGGTVSVNFTYALQSPLATSDTRTYSIGSVGPAGGLIFYDKGSFTDGWRYLEASPDDLKPAIWGPIPFPNKEIGGTSIEIGTGLQNTLRIMDKHKDKAAAAMACFKYSINGFSDWFLPSKNEMMHMWKNLIYKNIGGFKHYAYWSSSENDSHDAWVVWSEKDYSGAKKLSFKSYTKNKEPLGVRAARKF